MHFLKFVPLVGLLALGTVAEPAAQPVARDSAPPNLGELVDNINNAIHNNSLSVTIENLENIAQGGSDAVNAIRAANPAFWEGLQGLVVKGNSLLGSLQNTINKLPSLPNNL